MKNRILLLLPLVLGTFMAGIDSSIVNVSLPTMSKQFAVGLDDIEWIITAYMLGFCIFMPLTNWLKERIGFYKLYLISLAVFTLGSLLCAVSGSLESLIAARALQSFGGGAITPTAMAIITVVFPKEQRGKAMGWWSLGSIAGPAIGPTLGGLLTEYFGWPSIFYINLPIGIFTIAIAWRSLKFLELQPKTKEHFDSRGFILFTLFIVLFQYAVAIVSSKGIESPWFIAPLLGSATAFILFIKFSLANPHALFNLNIFKHRNYVYCVIITVVRSVALFGGTFLLPFLLQGQLGYSEMKSGLMILPNSLVMAFITPLAGGFSDKYDPRKLVVPGLILVALSMLQFSQINKPAEIYVILAMVCRGLGLGLLVSTLTSTAMSAVLPDEVTHASSMYSLIQQMGGSIGIAFSGLLQQYVMHYYAEQKGYTSQVSEHYAIQDVFITSAVLVALTVTIAARLPKNALIKRTEVKVAEV